MRLLIAVLVGWLTLGMLSTWQPALAQAETETPTPTPTSTPTSTETPTGTATLTPTGTPNLQMIATVESGQAVAINFTISAGETLISLELFIVIGLLLFGLLVVMIRK